MYDTTDPEDFPGFVGPNHAHTAVRGPLKSDWTKACPYDWTKEEQDEKCFSLQESVYGTKLLRELEAIKKNVDPTGMFTCQYCVGDNVEVSPCSREALALPILTNIMLTLPLSYSFFWPFIHSGPPRLNVKISPRKRTVSRLGAIGRHLVTVRLMASAWMPLSTRLAISTKLRVKLRRRSSPIAQVIP